MMNPFIYFQGAWRFHRVINNTLGNAVTASGDAMFSAVLDTMNRLDYHEQAKVMIENSSVVYTAQQRYHYDFNVMADHVDIKVKFWGREAIFHEMMLPYDWSANIFPLKQTASHHLCGQDEYQTHYHWINQTQFSIIYVVRGFSKHYCSTTIFERC